MKQSLDDFICQAAADKQSTFCLLFPKPGLLVVFHPPDPSVPHTDTALSAREAKGACGTEV